MWALSLGGQWMIDLLYDPRYAEAGWMLQILAAGAVGAVISVPASSILLAVGDSKRAHDTSGWTRTGPNWMHFGRRIPRRESTGMIVGVAASKIVDYPLLAWAIRRYGVWMPALDLGAFLLSAMVILGGHAYFGNLWTRHLLSDERLHNSNR
jgi:hypothetical protein